MNRQVGVGYRSFYEEKFGKYVEAFPQERLEDLAKLTYKGKLILSRGKKYDFEKLYNCWVTFKDGTDSSLESDSATTTPEKSPGLKDLYMPLSSQQVIPTQSDESD